MARGWVYQRGNRWWIGYRKDGEQIRESAGKTKKEATSLLTKRLGQIQTGTFLGLDAERATVKVLVEEHLADLKTRAKSHTDIKSALKPILEVLGDVRALDLTPTRIHAYIEARRAAGKANGTITQGLGHLRAALSAAYKRQRIPRDVFIPTAGTGKPRQGFLEVEDFDRILSHLEGVYADMTEFAYLTGWRYHEVTDLQWEWINRASREIRLPDSKNGEGRTLPIIDVFAGVIERRWKARALGCPYVFHLHGGHIECSWRDAFKEACQQAGYAAGLKDEGLIPHDMRRSAVRNMIRAGVPPHVAMKISGHKSEAVFQRYNITSTKDQEQALAMVSSYLSARRQVKGGLHTV